MTTVLPADGSAFAEQVERYRRELHVHCYRMVGSFDDAEDLLQETLLRAWRKRDTFQGRSTLRAWLYRIATNACLDFLDHRRRQPVPRDVGPGAEPGASPDEVPWLQPYPDRLLGEIAPGDSEPESAVIAKETIELTFLAAIQHLSPLQRAVLILRDVLGWSAKEAAELLDTSVASVNSALQRARPALKEHLPHRRLEWVAATDPSEQERALLQRYMDGHERADLDAMAELLREDARLTMPPLPDRFEGRDAIEAFARQALTSGSFGDFRLVPTRANLQPAAAKYLRRPGGSQFRAQSLDVLRIVEGRIAEITTFGPDLFPAFGLPATL